MMKGRLSDTDHLQTVRETRLLIDRYDKWLYEEYEEFLGQRILEIGSGYGNQLRNLIDRELVLGIDNSRDSVDHVNQMFRNYDNIQAVLADITSLDVLRLASYQFDTLISLNVFEHIKSQGIAFEHSAKLLIPGGIFILIVPAHQEIFGEIDLAIGHFRRYSKKDIRENIEKLGFKILRLKYVNMLGAIAWFINSKLLRQKVPPAGQLKVLNNIIPLLRFVENRVPALFGVSLLCIARRH